MNRKELLRQYKETPRPAGIYSVRHTPSGRTLLGASTDAPAMLNRIRAQLRMNAHPNRALLADWNAAGADAFTFDVVDFLPPSAEPGHDIREELAALEELWREKLGVTGATSY